MDTVTVYTKPACVQCSAVFRALKKAGIPFNEIDLTTDGDARDYVMSLGYLQAPSSTPDRPTISPASAPTASTNSRVKQPERTPSNELHRNHHRPARS